MVAVQIREVPEQIRDRLAAIALERGQSLQSYLLDVVTDEVRRRDNLAVLERFSRGSHGTRLSGSDVVGVLHAERGRRDLSLGIPGSGE
jgi:hypothetical protein